MKKGGYTSFFSFEPDRLKSGTLSVDLIHNLHYTFNAKQDISDHKLNITLLNSTYNKMNHYFFMALGHNYTFHPFKVQTIMT